MMFFGYFAREGFMRAFHRPAQAAAIFICAATFAGYALADEQSEMQTNFGQMIGDVQFAEKTCPTLQGNQELIGKLEEAAGVKVSDEATHTPAYLEGHAKSTKEAQEIVDEAKADGFCEIAVKAYGPEGIRAENLLIAK